MGSAPLIPRRWQIAAFVASIAALAGAIVYATTTGDDVHPATPVASAHPAPPSARPAPTPGVAHPAPFEAFSDARVGDWRAYQVLTTSSMAEFHSTVMASLVAVGERTVKRVVRGRIDNTGEQRTESPEELPRHGLTLERLIGYDVGGWTLSDLAVTHEAYLIGERAFGCTKLTYAASDPLLPRKRTRVTLWLSPEVPAGGVVARREEQHLDTLTFVIAEELFGYGTASSTTWGTRPAGW
jgi:hypothetical protein